MSSFFSFCILSIHFVNKLYINLTTISLQLDDKYYETIYLLFRYGYNGA
ncbi:hypothetical protein MUA48_09980 [Staphylococcus sp. IVB6238]|nr:hypothetical protein [Staphylococcus sp. IVB6238]UXR73669.1 hypothetical protein MUA48_09980 [Staphylococcus sp. IVB6238]